MDLNYSLLSKYTKEKNLSELKLFLFLKMKNNFMKILKMNSLKNIVKNQNISLNRNMNKIQKKRILKILKKDFARTSIEKPEEKIIEKKIKENSEVVLEEMFKQDDSEDLTDWEKDFNEETDDIWKEELKNMKKGIDIKEILKKAELEKSEFFKKIEKPTINEEEIIIQSIPKSHISLFNFWSTRKKKFENEKISENISGIENWFNNKNWDLKKNVENKSILKLEKKIKNTKIEIFCKYENPRLKNPLKKEREMLNIESNYLDNIREIIAENQKSKFKEIVFNFDFFIVCKGPVNNLIFDCESYEGILKFNKIIPIDTNFFFEENQKKIGEYIFYDKNNKEETNENNFDKKNQKINENNLEKDFNIKNEDNFDDTFSNDFKFDKENIRFEDLENLKNFYNGPYFREMDFHFETAFREFISLLGIEGDFAIQLNLLSYLLFEQQEINFERKFTDFISNF